MIKWSTRLAAVAVLVWLPSATDDADSRPPTGSPASTDEMQPTAKPAIRGNRPLSIAEIRWCMSQEIWLQAVQPRLATRDAIDRHNQRAGDYNRHCNSRKYRESDREEASRDIEAVRRLIVDAALEDIRRVNGGRALTRRTQDLLDLLAYDPGVIDGAYGEVWIILPTQETTP